jgi:hypothetical protein
VLDGSGWLTPHSGRFTPENNAVLILQEAGWASDAVWKGGENLTSTFASITQGFHKIKVGFKASTEEKLVREKNKYVLFY